MVWRSTADSVDDDGSVIGVTLPGARRLPLGCRNGYAQDSPGAVKGLARCSLFATMPTRFRNRLSHKGLPVPHTRLFRNVQMICVLATLAVLGLQDVAAAQTPAPRGPSQTQPRLRLTQPRIRVSGTQPATPPAGKGVIHVVRRGETLSSIARRYGTTVAAVQRWNGLRGSAIRAGQRLTVFTRGGPVAAPTAASRGEQVTHVIRRGETLSSISRRYGTTAPPCRGGTGSAGVLSTRASGSPSSPRMVLPHRQRRGANR